MDIRLVKIAGKSVENRWKKNAQNTFWKCICLAAGFRLMIIMRKLKFLTKVL